MTQIQRYLYDIHTDQIILYFLFFFSSRRRHTRCLSDWSSDVCSSDLIGRAHFFFSSRRRHTRCLSDWSSDVCSSDLAALLIRAEIAMLSVSAGPNWTVKLSTGAPGSSRSLLPSSCFTENAPSRDRKSVV